MDQPNQFNRVFIIIISFSYSADKSVHPFVVKYTKARHMFKTEIAQLDMKEKRCLLNNKPFFCVQCSYKDNLLKLHHTRSILAVCLCTCKFRQFRVPISTFHHGYQHAIAIVEQPINDHVLVITVPVWAHNCYISLVTSQHYCYLLVCKVCDFSFLYFVSCSSTNGRRNSM